MSDLTESEKNWKRNTKRGNGIPKRKDQYVHEMQHAMRLMGLHGLADNFIIEKGGQQ